MTTSTQPDPGRRSAGQPFDHRRTTSPQPPLRAADDDFFAAAPSMLLARNWWAVALRGLLAIAFGIIALVWPGLTLLTVVLVFAAYLIVDGIFAIVSSINAARSGERWVMLALSGVLSILAGGIAFAWPGITLAAMLILIAAWSIVSGVLTFASAFRLNIEHGRVWLALGGLAQLAFGILLLAAPVIGAVVLTWWLGLYAIIFGIFMIVLAFQLRSRLEDSPAAVSQRGRA